MTRPYLVNSTSEEYDLVKIRETVLLSRKKYLAGYLEKHGKDAQDAFLKEMLPQLTGDQKAGKYISLIDCFRRMLKSLLLF